MTQEELLELLRGFGSSLFRLEARQVYTVPQEADRLRAFAQGRPLPPRPAGSLQLVTDAVAAGKRIERVRVIEYPLTDYTRFELAAYPENVAAGERIWIADRDRQPGELAELTEDFLLVDDRILVWIRYDDAGRLLGWERSGDPADLDRCRRQRDVALAVASPLDQYLDRLATIQATHARSA